MSEDSIEYEDTTSSTDSSTDDSRISLMSSTSRATINTLDELEGDTSGFGVMAVIANSSDFYIDGAGYTKASGSWAWASGDYSWPDSSASYPMSFYAYYPLTDTAVVFSEDNVAGSDSFEATVTIQSVDSQTDLLAAQSSVDIRPAGGAISLSFDHILSQVSLSVKAGAGCDVHVQSVTFKAMLNKNIYDYASKSWATLSAGSDESVLYPYLAVHSPATVVDSAGTTTISPDNGSLMLLPQTLSHWDTDSGDSATGARVVIVYRVTSSSDKSDVVGFSEAEYTKGDDTETILKGPLFIKVGYPVDGTWEAGQSYNYVVELGGASSSGGYYVSTSYFDASGVETNLVVGGDDSDVEVGDTVYDEEINFTVSVNGWGSVAESELD